MIKITCPFCSFSKEVSQEKIVNVASKVRCPVCNETFIFTFFEHKKASFFSRLLAFIIDMLLLNAIFLIVSFGIDWSLSYLFQSFGITDEDFSNIMIGSIIYFVCVSIMFFYYVYFTHVYGKTLGKAVLGIKVVNKQGKNPEISEVLKREVIGKILSSLLFGMGYIWALFDRNNQALHDKIARTYVIYS